MRCDAMRCDRPGFLPPLPAVLGIFGLASSAVVASAFHLERLRCAAAAAAAADEEEEGGPGSIEGGRACDQQNRHGR